MLDVTMKMGNVNPPLSGFFCLKTCSYVLMCKKETHILSPAILNLIVSIDQEYLWEVLNYVWEDGLTELEVQRKYFSILEKELKGEDRLYLETVYKTIKELESKDSQGYVPNNEYPSPDSIIKK